MPFAATQMSLQISVLREISQKEKDKYPMVSFIGVIKKLIPMNKFPQRKTLTDLKENLMVNQK